MKRISVIGCCGAGKSTFSKELAKKTNTPLYHLDHLFWKPGWIEEDEETFKQKQKALITQPEWIIDGNYTRTIPVRITAADTVFFFDFHPRFCICRAIKRILKYHGRTRPDMAEGCHERFNWSFLKYIARFRHETRPRIVKALENHASHCKIIVFKKPSDITAWLENYERSQ